MDHASIHTKRAVRAWLQGHSCLKLTCLPTRRGHRLNVLEKVW